MMKRNEMTHTTKSLIKQIEENKKDKEKIKDALTKAYIFLFFGLISAYYTNMFQQLPLGYHFFLIWTFIFLINTLFFLFIAMYIIITHFINIYIKKEK